MQRVSYKPGWKMTVVDFPGSQYSPWLPSYKIVMVYTVQNPDNPNTISTFTFERDWRDEDTDRSSDAWVIEMVIANSIQYAERDQFDKWFKVDGFRFNRETMHAARTNPPSANPDPQLPRTDQEVR